MTQLSNSVQRKIIHIDMDCFYAAIEMRDNPELMNKPVAVGGSSLRGVLCTCNYAARKFGVRSAMPTGYALRLCPDLVVLPVNMKKYKDAAKIIHSIFREYTDLVEPLSLDEAFLDVSNVSLCQGSATLISREIKNKIFSQVQITASAGVAPNKFLAKIASGWQKPNGLFVIRPHEVEAFVKALPVKELFGVGKVTAEKLHNMGLKVCADLQQFELIDLTNKFGKFGHQLYAQSRGIDEREVIPNRMRKSLSVEETYTINLTTKEECLNALDDLHGQLLKRLSENAADRQIKNQYVKIKYSNFKQTSMEKISDNADLEKFKLLISQNLAFNNLTVRLLGIGVHFYPDDMPIFHQQSLL